MKRIEYEDLLITRDGKVKNPETGLYQRGYVLTCPECGESFSDPKVEKIFDSGKCKNCGVYMDSISYPIYTRMSMFEVNSRIFGPDPVELEEFSEEESRYFFERRFNGRGENKWNQ